MRLGILLLGDLSIRVAVAVARDAEAAGLDSVHQVEAYRSGFVPLAAIAAATSRIGLGTYIANAYGRSPFLTALSALDLDELSGGRFTLGVGSRHLNEQSRGSRAGGRTGRCAISSRSCGGVIPACPYLCSAKAWEAPSP